MTAQEKAAADKVAADKAAADKAAADKAASGTKITFTKSHQAYAYHAGETGELPADRATKLIADGYAQAFTDEQR